MNQPPVVVSRDVELAHSFLATLADLRSPWAVLFEAWADGVGLEPEMRRTVKTTVLRLRTFHAIERSRRRRA